MSLPIVNLQDYKNLHGILRDKRIPLPACAYHAIRSTFNLSKNEHFEGYEEIDL